MIRYLILFQLFCSALLGTVDFDAKIWVVGHKGLVGSSVVRRLRALGYKNLILRTHQELDLCDAVAVKAFYSTEKPEYVILAAAKVGGILANTTYPAEFIYNNLSIELNVIHNAYVHNVKKLVFLGSSCIYPKECPNPIQEDYLLTGALEPTNQWYAIAKISGLKLCQAYRRQYGCRFISLMPTNLYGIEDNFDLETSHVLPALIRKFIEAKDQGKSSVTLWGTGTPMREFLYVDDLADAIVWSLNHYEGEQWLNIGTGQDISIYELAQLIARLVGYTGDIIWDRTKPDGTMRKLLDVSKVRDLGWEASVPLEEGLKRVIDWYNAKAVCKKSNLE